MKAMNGSCLCGSVSINFETDKNTFAVCHCGMCRRWGGGPLMTIEGGTHVKFKGESSISTFNSSDWAERGFCKNCGTHLFYRLKEKQQYYIPMGLMNNTGDLKFEAQIFVDMKPENYNFANKTHMMTQAEVFAQAMS